MTITETNLSFSKPVAELIQKRYSCRTYLKQPIDKITRQLLRDYAAAQQTGPLGGQARFELVAGRDDDLAELKGLGTYGFIKGATGFIVGATSADAKHLEDFGFLMEKIILYATDLNLGTCWLGGTFTKTSFSRKIAVKEGELVPSVAATGYISSKPRRIEKLFRRDTNTDRRRAWSELFFNNRFDLPLNHQQADSYAMALNMVRLAPSASNKQPWRVVKDGSRWHFYLQRNARYRDRRLVKISTVADLQRIDIGIAMCHFELSARELGLQGTWLVDEPPINKPDDLTEYTASWQA